MRSSLYPEELVAECDAVSFLAAHQQVVTCLAHYTVREVDLLLIGVHHASTLHALHSQIIPEFYFLKHALGNSLCPVAVSIHSCVVAVGLGAG